MRIVMVRHGETKENKHNISQGQLPGKLTRKGRLQAKKLAKRLENEYFDIIYCSDLKRAKKTLKKIIRHHPDTTVVYTPELRERSEGIFEGQLHSKIHAFSKEHNIDWQTFKPPGGETYAEKDQRAINFFRKTLKLHPQANTLWVTHGGIVFSILNALDLNKSNLKLSDLNNASISIFNIDNKGTATAELVNCTKHLE